MPRLVMTLLIVLFLISPALNIVLNVKSIVKGFVVEPLTFGEKVTFYKVNRRINLLKRTVPPKYYLIFRENFPICAIAKFQIKILQKELNDPTTHPLQRWTLMRVLSNLPTSPVKGVVIWNESQFRGMKMRLGMWYMTMHDELEARRVFIDHEIAENEAGDGMEYSLQNTTLGQTFSLFVARLISRMLPKAHTFMKHETAVSLHRVLLRRANFMICWEQFIYEAMLLPMVDAIDGALGQDRHMNLMNVGPSCAHYDPYVLIKESNSIYRKRNKTVLTFCRRLRMLTGEYQALRAAGLKYGKEYRNPSDLTLRRNIYREYTMSGTLLRNLPKLLKCIWR